MNGADAGRARRMRLLAVLTLLVVFVAGGLVGAAVERGRSDDRRVPDRPTRAERRGPPPMFAEGSPVARRLQLTEAQRARIEQISRRDRARADSAFRDARRGMRARFDSTLMAVDSVLTPQQRAEWQQIREQWQMREGRGRRGRRGLGPGADSMPRGGPMRGL